MIVDTEVFHRVCVGRVAQSVVTKLKLANIELRRQVAQLQADASEVSRLRTAIDDANRDARTVRAERDTLERNLARYVRRCADAENRVRELEDGYDQLRRDEERIRAQITDLQQDIRRLSTPEPGMESGATTKNDLDDSEQRFRLLELDPLE